MKSAAALGPGATLGVVGGGQLGRYFVLEARRLGYDTWVLDPDSQAPAMQIAAHPLVARYDDSAALDTLAAACDAVTIEFENVPAASLLRIAAASRVAPAASSVQLAQDRLLEKQRARECGLTPVPHAGIDSMAGVSDALAAVGLPAILKTTRLGYDGKGQVSCRTAAEVQAAFASFEGVPCVLEQQIALVAEISVVLARGFDGISAVFPVAENVHEQGILFTSTVPAQQPDALLKQAARLAVALADGLDHHGVLAVEFFIDQAGQLLFNEMAPRPHNSAHFTLDATLCSQFEQQLRALCALPLGSTTLLSPVSMLNVLGDLWDTTSPDFAAVYHASDCQLHLYGKSVARPGRKMGHVNCLAETPAQALCHAQTLHQQLLGRVRQPGSG